MAAGRDAAIAARWADLPADPTPPPGVWTPGAPGERRGDFPYAVREELRGRAGRMAARAVGLAASIAEDVLPAGEVVMGVVHAGANALDTDDAPRPPDPRGTRP